MWGRVVGALLVAAALAAALLAGGGPSAAPAAAGRCGVERWAVKTLTDPRARLVSLVPRRTSVDRLRALPAPAVLLLRIAGVETTTWRVRALLLAAKVEADRDIHLVIADPRDGATMIAELPDPSCTAGAPAADRARMRSARAAFVAACGLPGTTRFSTLRGRTTIDGVGFFDFAHGQRGLAPNAIELHPVVGFRGTCSG
jgi:hypothetical protein